MPDEDALRLVWRLIMARATAAHQHGQHATARRCRQAAVIIMELLAETRSKVA